MAISEEKIARVKELRVILKKRQKETKKLADECRAIETEYFDDLIAHFKTLDLNGAYLHTRIRCDMFDTKSWPERASEGTFIHIIKCYPIQQDRMHCIMEWFDVGERCYNEKKIYYGVHSEPIQHLGDIVIISKEDYERARLLYMKEIETELEKRNSETYAKDLGPFCCGGSVVS
ncbi:MAG: hypothetical protein LUD72_07895 [Bacteroidales bacterium]|nr:hypothetical protein [Bacteroidales bacterium]